tara:strand:+ start:1221 stop:5024 length:3804 start_codon:yes stop_codon:yes gene_type:complete
VQRTSSYAASHGVNWDIDESSDDEISEDEIETPLLLRGGDIDDLGDATSIWGFHSISPNAPRPANKARHHSVATSLPPSFSETKIEIRERQIERKSVQLSSSRSLLAGESCGVDDDDEPLLFLQAPSPRTSEVAAFSRIQQCRRSADNGLSLQTREREGYSHVTLEEASLWSRSTKERILLELAYKVEHREFATALSYYIERSDWRGVIRLVSQLDLRGAEVDSMGMVRPQSADSELWDAFDALERELSRATPYIRNILHDSLAARGLFFRQRFPRLVETTSPPPSPSPRRNIHITSDEGGAALSWFRTNWQLAVAVADDFAFANHRAHFKKGEETFSSLLRQLASSAQLFPERGGGGNEHCIDQMIDGSSKLLSLGKVLPQRTASFHTFVVAFCAEHGLFHFLREYVDSHCIGNDADDLAHLRRGLDAAHWTPWLAMLLLGRIGTRDALFHAALANAAFCGLPTSVDAMVSSGRTLLALGVLAYAPDDDGEDGDGDTDFHHLSRITDHATFARQVARWPSLHRALFHVAPALPAAPPRMSCDIRTLANDVGVYDLLEDAAPFDVKALFGQQQQQQQQQHENQQQEKTTARSTLHFSSPSLSDDAHSETLDSAYYLTKGRPMAALMSLDLEEGVAMSQSAAHSLVQLTRRVAMRHLPRENVRCACVAFLHACGLGREAETLRVDQDAALRILRYRTRRVQGPSHLSDDPRADSDALIRIGDLFIAFPLLSETTAVEEEGVQGGTGPASVQATQTHSVLVSALKLLGEATREMVRSSQQEQEQPAHSETANSFSVSAWKLVTLFCRVHGLPRSLALLHELARRNDWVMFLHEAQRERCPAPVMMQALANFSDERLKAHLFIVAQKGHDDAVEKEESTDESTHDERNRNCDANGGGAMMSIDSALLEGTSCVDDVFDILFDAASLASQTSQEEGEGEGGGVASRSLLLSALEQQRPILAIIATCFREARRLDCWIIWLLVLPECSEELPVDVLPWRLGRGADGQALPEEVTTSPERVNQSMLSNLNDGLSSPISPLSRLSSPNTDADDVRAAHVQAPYLPEAPLPRSALASVLSHLCRRQSWAPLLRGLHVFGEAEDEPLLAYFLFYRAFVLRRYDAAARHALRYAELTDGAKDAHVPSSTVEPEWIRTLCDGETYVLLRRTVATETVEEVGELLKILAEAHFSGDCSRLYASFILLRRTGLLAGETECSGTGLHNLWSPPDVLIKLLLKHHRFVDARTYAKEVIESERTGAWPPVEGTRAYLLTFTNT